MQLVLSYLSHTQFIFLAHKKVKMMKVLMYKMDLAAGSGQEQEDFGVK